jgi:glycosyltransferase involved in cell wall biosynthesis
MKNIIARAKRAGIRHIIGYWFSVVCITVCIAGRKIRYNYYLKNWVERRRNKKLLSQARNNSKDNLSSKNPLISVPIPTWNRGKILTERTIPSILRQTYQNFEIVIVGDHCTDNTEELLRKFNDKRIRFYNLPKRGEYPVDPMDRWMVAGAGAATKSLELSSGDWIAPLDDDDEFSEDHLEVLLDYALEHDYEMVYGMVKMEIQPGKWKNVGSYPLKPGHICRLSVLYHAKLKFFKADTNCWKYGEPGDWNMWRRMKEAGVRIGFLDKVVGKHYLERQRRE